METVFLKETALERVELDFNDFFKQ
jgi:hypothetical protein